MPKERTQKKEAKKKLALTPKEKQAAQRSKKAGKLAASAEAGRVCAAQAVPVGHGLLVVRRTKGTFRAILNRMAS
jgi:hypothetical protein